MSSRKQQALDRLLDVSGPGCFNEVTGTWMVGRRHHHHHHHRVSPSPPPAPEPAPEPEASEPEAPETSATTDQSRFYPDISRMGPMSRGARFSSTYIYPNYPYMHNYRPGTLRRNYVVTNVSVRGIGRFYTIAFVPSPSSTTTTSPSPSTPTKPTHLIKTVMDYPPMSAFPKNSTGGSIIPIGTIYRSQPTKYGHAFGPPVLMWVKAPHQYVQISLAQANTIPQ